MRGCYFGTVAPGAYQLHLVWIQISPERRPPIFVTNPSRVPDDLLTRVSMAASTDLFGSGSPLGRDGTALLSQRFLPSL